MWCVKFLTRFIILHRYVHKFDFLSVTPRHPSVFQPRGCSALCVQAAGCRHLLGGSGAVFQRPGEKHSSAGNRKNRLSVLRIFISHSGCQPESLKKTKNNPDLKCEQSVITLNQLFAERIETSGIWTEATQCEEPHSIWTLVKNQCEQSALKI